MAVSLVRTIPVTISVSSTSDAKLFGKKYLIDGKEDTCWSSDQGKSQWLKVKFPTPVCVQELRLMFQGGFTSRTIKVTFGMNDETIDAFDIHPQDVNSFQSFPINNRITCDTLRLDFIDFNDFYGRIVIYTFDILGENKAPN